MSDLERAKATSNSALTAMRHYLDIRLVPIFTRYREKAFSIGSGTCLKIKDRYFIITAGHVISDYSKKDISILLAGWGKSPLHVTNFLNIGYIDDEASGLDIGYLEISKEEAEKLQKEFIEPNVFRTNINHLTNDTVLSCGYPDEIIKREQTEDFNRYTVRASHFQTMTLPADKWPENFNNGIHILLKYPKMVEDVDGNSVKIPDAPGISGGGIWAMNAKFDGIWSTGITNLIGIHTRWNSKERFLVGVQIQHWINLINRNYDDINI